MKKQAVIRLLKEVLETMTMETARFSSDEKTQMIKDETKLWRETWIIYPLEQVLKEVSK